MVEYRGGVREGEGVVVIVVCGHVISIRRWSFSYMGGCCVVVVVVVVCHGQS